VKQIRKQGYRHLIVAKQTCAAQPAIFAVGQNVHLALLDHFVRAADECVGDVDSERLGGLEIDVKLDFGCQLDR
jgi:hypothetical protein